MRCSGRSLTGRRYYPQYFASAPNGALRTRRPWSHCQFRRLRSLIAGLFLATVAISLSQPSAAQTIAEGEAVVTRFSGFDAASGFTLDPQGPVVLVVDIRSPDTPAAGQAWRDADVRVLAEAGTIGQVFGIAIDDADPPNIYAAASSAYGAYQLPSGDWAPGQWGPAGGPGTVYRLDGSNGYAAERFAEITLGGRANTGAALGNIAFDAAHRQLFVSDLETGMIHRLGLDGFDRGTFDHGQTGRAGFVDAATGESMALPAVAFDPGTAARRDDCPAEFGRSPECWNMADFRRRVWGLAVHKDTATGKSRLYYSVWSAQGFGNPEWQADPAEQSNSVWSIGLTAGGDFDFGDIRRELTVPGFFAELDDYNRAGPSNPVTDVALSANGDMFLAERGGLRGPEDGPRDSLIWPHESRILHYRLDEAGAWQPAGRHDIGNGDRADLGPPHLRASAAGGVASGPGYTTAGRQDPDQPDAFVWATGDELCQIDAPCVSGSSGGADGDPLYGLQGQPGDAPAELSPAEAYADYPEPGPATPGDAATRSYFVEVVQPGEAGWAGDVEIVAGAAPPAEGPANLAVTKSMPEFCLAGAICTARVTVTNIGPGNWSGPLFLRDVLIPTGPDIDAVAPPWTCAAIGPEFLCYLPTVDLAPGQFRTLTMDIAVPGALASDILENCAEIAWPFAGPSDQQTVIRAAQMALTLLGYDPGPIDGVFGPRTSAAIMALQSDVGIEPTGILDQTVIGILFPDLSALPGDAGASNDQACAESEILGNPPVGGVHLPVGSTPGHVVPHSIHQPIGSAPGHAFPVSVHQPAGSGPFHVFPHSVHQPWGSGPGHVFPGSVHLPAGSLPGHIFPASIHLPAGSLPGHGFPASVHLPAGSIGGHAFPLSVHFPVGSAPGQHVPPLSVHLPVGSGGPHGLPASLHLPIGSGPGHLFPASIHLPIGSHPGHVFPNSIHFPFGSAPGHVFPQSVHQPAGSLPGHAFPFSVHQPVGSVGGHVAPLSVHLPLGSNPGHLFPISAHFPAGSNPGHVFPASLHQPIGSTPAHPFPQSIHLPVGSGSGHVLAQSIHQPVGSGPGHEPPQSVHLPFGSNLHGAIGSLHFPPGSGTHQPVGSLHGPVQSSPQLHAVAESNAHTPVGSVHLPVGSGGHFPPGSLHFPAGSAHQPPGSGGHQIGQSLHIPAGSNLTQPPSPAPAPPPGGGGGLQPHQPVGSVHLPVGSVQPHRPIGSAQPHRPVGSVHLPVGSVQPHRPIGSIHQPVGSVQPHRPIGSVHQPVGSVQPHRPVGSVHQPVGSRPQVHLPLGSRPQVHLPLGSRPQTHTPPGSRPQQHLPLGSRPQVHTPPGSTPQLHLPLGSRPQVHTPPGSQQPAHTPPGSRPQVHTPPGSTPQLHLPRRSRQQSEEEEPDNVHSPPGSPETVHNPTITRQQLLRRLQQNQNPTSPNTTVR